MIRFPIAVLFSALFLSPAAPAAEQAQSDAWSLGTFFLPEKAVAASPNLVLSYAATGELEVFVLTDSGYVLTQDPQHLAEAKNLLADEQAGTYQFVSLYRPGKTIPVTTENVNGVRQYRVRYT